MKIISKGKPANQIKPVRADSKKALILKVTLDGGVYTVKTPEGHEAPGNSLGSRG